MPDPRDLSDEEADLLNITREDPEAEAEARRENDLKQEVRRDLLANTLMGNALFREWLMEKLTAFGTFENTFAVGPGAGFPDPLATWFKAGMKAAGWALWEELDAVAPDLASLMRRGG